MRLLVILLALCPAASFAMPKADCSRAAERFSSALPTLKSLEDALSETVYWPFVNGTPELDGAAEQADAARRALVEPFRAYIAAMEDLTYQLQRCARG